MEEERRRILEIIGALKATHEVKAGRARSDAEYSAQRYVIEVLMIVEGYIEGGRTLEMLLSEM